MKILKITYEWPPPWEGLVPHPYELTKAQVALGNEFFVFSGRWPFNGSPEEPEGVKLLHFLGNPSLPFRAPVEGTLLVTFAPILLFRYIKFRVGKGKDIDLIHSHGHFGLWIYWYRKMLSKFFPKSRELRTPFVVHFHNTVEGRWKKLEENEKDIKPISKYFDWPLAKKSDKLAVEIADALIFVSEEVKNEAIEYYGADPAKCFVVESGVNPDLFKPMGGIEKEKVQKDLGLEEQDVLILNLGVQVERKNIHLLVESLMHLSERYKLLLVGPFPDDGYRGRIDKFIQDNKLTERVLFGGYQPYPEVPILYQGADIFVLPSLWEGMPKVVMESVSTGVPVLCSGFKIKEDIPGIFYLDNLDPANIAKKISDIIENSVFVDRNKFVAYYSWESRAKKVEQIYELALNNRAKATEKYSLTDA